MVESGLPSSLCKWALMAMYWGVFLVYTHFDLVPPLPGVLAAHAECRVRGDPGRGEPLVEQILGHGLARRSRNHTPKKKRKQD